MVICGEFIIFDRNYIYHLFTMKRLFIAVISAIALTGCTKSRAIQFIGPVPVLDGSGQTVILNTDVRITSFRIKTNTSSGSSLISNKISEDGNTLICEDTWFKATTDRATGRQISLELTENDRDSNRSLAITVHHLCFESATLELIQPAQSR